MLAALAAMAGTARMVENFIVHKEVLRLGGFVEERTEGLEEVLVRLEMAVDG